MYCIVRDISLSISVIKTTQYLCQVLEKWLPDISSLIPDPTLYYFRVPTRTGKPGKMGRHFPVREKSGKITQNTGKLREFQTNIMCYSSVTAKLNCILLAKFDKVFS